MRKYTIINMRKKVKLNFSWNKWIIFAATNLPKPTEIVCADLNEECLLVVYRID